MLLTRDDVPVIIITYLPAPMKHNEHTSACKLNLDHDQAHNMLFAGKEERGL